MKKYFYVLLLLAPFLLAGQGPSFTVTDTNGNTWDSDSLLAEGITIVVNFFSPSMTCWPSSNATENISKVVDLDDLLSYERKEDEGNGLWEVYNRVQESLVQGKFHYIGGNKKSRKARPIKNFKQSIHVNQKLSELAFAYV